MLTRLINRFPHLSAASVYAIAVVLAFNRFFSGLVLLTAPSDQLEGYPPRLFAAEYLSKYGSIPEWNPFLFGGIPFVANTGFGDTFFPTFLLRLLLPVDQGMALGFLVFTFLAGFFAFLFLRALPLTWGASFVGGAAYMFTGMVLSLSRPGHDGKLFVAALLPIALLFLYKAVSRGDWRFYLYFGVTVGFSLLTPHFQATYYLLMASGFFWFFMVFLGGARAEQHSWWMSAASFVVALGLGFAIASVQLLPFMEYVPFSPRGVQEGMSQGWNYAVSWSMPPEEMLAALFPGILGSGVENYFGRNPFKLHSEYFGAVVVMLALASFRLAERKKLAWFFVFLAAYGALFAFGGHTPFYQLPYNILPGIARTRAPSIIFFLSAFSVSVLAAFGTEYLLARVGTAADSARRTVAKAGNWIGELQVGMFGWFGLLLLMALLASVGGMQGVMESLAGIQGMTPGWAAPDQARLAAVARNEEPFMRHIWIAALLAGAALFVTVPSTLRKMGVELVALLLGVVVLLDLYAYERSYIQFSQRADVLKPADDVVATLKSDTTLHRVLPLAPLAEEYETNYFMAHGVRTALGHNGFELHAYDELLGGKNSWSQLGQSAVTEPSLWRLLGVKYVVSGLVLPPVDSVAPELRDFVGVLHASLELVSDDLTSYTGRKVALYRLRDPQPYALLVGAAWKVEAELGQVVSTVLSPQFQPDGLLLLPDSAGVGADSVSGFAPRIDNAVAAREERPGKLSFTFAAPAANDAYLYVAENYYPAWSARVDGAEATVVPAQASMMAVPVPAGARSVELEFSLKSYHTGRIITIVTLLFTLCVAAFGVWTSRKEKSTG